MPSAKRVVMPTPQQTAPPKPKNPRRVEAGKRNRALRRGITATGRQRLKDAITRHKPWLKASGPKTPQGKRQAARNGLRGKTDSARQINRELKFLQSLVDGMRKSRLWFDEWRCQARDGLDRDVRKDRKAEGRETFESCLCAHVTERSRHDAANEPIALVLSHLGAPQWVEANAHTYKRI